MSRTASGLVLVALGVALGVIFGLADVMGLSTSDSAEDEVGWLQILGIAVGVVAVVVGIVLAVFRGRRRRTTSRRLT